MKPGTQTSPLTSIEGLVSSPSAVAEAAGVLDCLRHAGLDLGAWFVVDPDEPSPHGALWRESWRSACCPSWLEVGTACGPQLGLMIGNTRQLWSAFLRSLSASGAAADVVQRKSKPDLVAQNPLDGFVESAVDRALRCWSGPRHWVGFAHRLEPAIVPMQRLAVYSGLANWSPAGLVVHPEFGPWIALRACVVFDVTVAAQRGLPLNSPCSGCPAPCSPRALEAHRGDSAFDDDSPLDPRRPVPLGLSAMSRRWLRVRDACPVGVEHRYSAEQIVYHYDKQTSALAAASATRRPGGSSPSS